MASLPPTPREQVRVMKALERDVLAAIDRVVGGGGGGAPSTSGSQRRQGRDRWGDDPAHAAKTGMARLRRELSELEAIVEEQARPADRSACLEALAERRESHDSIRQILRDATLRAADAEANAATSAAVCEGDERDRGRGARRRGERTRGRGARHTDGRGGRRGTRGRRHRGAPKSASDDGGGAGEGTEDARRDGRVPRDDEEDRGRVRRGSGRGARRGREAPEAAGATGGARAVGAVGGIRVFRARRAPRGAQTDAAAGEVPPAVVDTQESRDDGEGGEGGGAARGEGREGCRRGVAKRARRTGKPRDGASMAWRAWPRVWR